jgi:hypothetical protein
MDTGGLNLRRLLDQHATEAISYEAVHGAKTLTFGWIESSVMRQVRPFQYSKFLNRRRYERVGSAPAATRTTHIADHTYICALRRPEKTGEQDVRVRSFLAKRGRPQGLKPIFCGANHSPALNAGAVTYLRVSSRLHCATELIAKQKVPRLASLARDDKHQRIVNGGWWIESRSSSQAPRDDL